MNVGTANRFWWVGQWVSVDRITCSVYCLLDGILEMEEFVGTSVKCAEHIHRVSNVGRYVYIYIYTSFMAYIVAVPNIFCAPKHHHNLALSEAHSHGRHENRRCLGKHLDELLSTVLLYASSLLFNWRK